MGLKKLESSLTNVKFGKDRPGGGSSNQPYITTDIPSDRSGTSTLENILDKGSLKIFRSAKDVSRLTQYFTDLKSFSGAGFTINQNILSRTNVDIRAGSEKFINTAFNIPGGIYNPLNTIAQAGEVAFGHHYPRQGLLPKGGLIGGIVDFIDDNLNLGIGNYTSLEQPKYLDFYEGKGEISGYYESRLSYLHKKHGYEFKSSSKSYTNNLLNNYLPKFDIPKGLNTITDFINNTPYVNSVVPKIKYRDPVIYNYNGGPNLTKTEIKFYQNSLIQNLQEGETFQKKYIEETKENYRSLNNLSYRYLTEYGEKFTPSDYNNKVNLPGAKNNNTEDKDKIIDKSDPRIINFRDKTYPKITDFRIKKHKDLKPWGGVKTVESGFEGGSRIKMNDPAHRKKPGNKHTGDNYSLSPYIVDEINSSGLSDTKYQGDDLIKFRIGVLDRETNKYQYIQFRAYIDSFDDGYSAEWGSYQFMGRGEKFYKYKGFDRDINLDFTVAALSKPELIPIYKKLNYLASIIAPDYGSNGYMSGNIVNLTLGGYLYEVPGILEGFRIAPHEDSPWEIGISYNGGYETESGIEIMNSGSWDENVKELPMVIKVTGFKFKPIHNFTPKIQSDYEKGTVRFISLETGNNNNYDG